MTNMRKLLEAVDSMEKAAKKPTGPKFPGYWKGKDPASKSHTKMVGGCEESVLKDLHNTAKQKVTEWTLEEAYRNFKENEQATATPQSKQTKTKPIPPMPTNPSTDSWQELWKNNPEITNPHLIKPGQGIKLPYDGGTYQVQKGDTLSGIAAKLRGDSTAAATGKYPAMTMPDHIIGQIPGVESGNNPNAVSPKGALGAWQTMPATLKDPGYGVEPARDTSAAEMNRVGKDYAHAMFSKYGGDAEKALAAYNAGPGRIDQAIRQAAEKGGTWKDYIPGETKAYLPKFNLTPPEQVAMREGDAEDTKIAGRYDPDNFDAMVSRVKKLAQQQERKHGPVDIAKLAKKLRALDQKEKTNEVEDPATNKQDPDIQATSQTSVQQDPAAVKQQEIDQMQDTATAKSTMSGLSSVLGPKVDTNMLSSAVTKISDQKPLTAPEATSMSALTPLIAKAAESPQSAPALKTALSNAAMLARQGK